MSNGVELYEKELIAPGWYQADGGPMNVTPERIDRWERYFKHLKHQGYQFPTPWGHKLEAVPTKAGDPYALDEVYARWNAGYIEDVYRKANGKLYALATVPPGYRAEKGTGRLVNDRDGTVVRETSPGFGDWIDGKGIEHKDILFHCALVTHPVQVGQEGFTPTNRMASAQPAAVRFLSAAGRVKRLYFFASPPKGFPMADDNDADDKKKKKGGPDDSPIPSTDDATELPPVDDAPEIPAPPGGGGDVGGEPGDISGTVITGNEPPPGAEPPMPEAAPEAPDPAGLGASGFNPTQVEQMKQIFATLGQPLLPDTNQQNIVERVIVLLHAAANQGASLVASGGNDQQAQALDLSTAGATPDPGASGIGGPGAGGMSFMSTKTLKPIHLDPSGLKLAENAAAAERKAICDEWDAIAAGGPHGLKQRAAKEKELVNRFHMSLNPDTGEVLIRGARARLGDAKALLASAGVFNVKRMLSKSVAQASPSAGVRLLQPNNGAQPANEADMKKEICRLTGADPDNVKIIGYQPA